LPYARHVDDVTLELRDGLLMQTDPSRRLLFETADSDELNYRAELRDAMLRAIGSSRFAIHHHVIRRRADAGARGEATTTSSPPGSTSAGAIASPAGRCSSTSCS
jgi:type IV secretion system protein VirB4